MTLDTGTLSTTASITSAFGAAMLVFRIQRELEMNRAGEINWIPLCDWLLIGATEISLLLVLVALTMLSGTSRLANLPVAACACASVLLAGYIPAVLAHYRLIFAGGRSGARTNPEPSERIIVIVTCALALLTAIVVFRKV